MNKWRASAGSKLCLPASDDTGIQFSVRDGADISLTSVARLKSVR